MSSNPFLVLILIACGIVAMILIWGLGNFGIGGDPKTSNKLMQWRIIAQFFAVVIIVGIVWLQKGTGN